MLATFKTIDTASWEYHLGCGILGMAGHTIKDLVQPELYRLYPGNRDAEMTSPEIHNSGRSYI